MTYRRRAIAAALRQQVRQRANYLCEYCHAAEQWQYTLFTLDHVVPLSKGGSDTADNLALACAHCNRRKSESTRALDPRSRTEVPLFNPRHDHWSDHFQWAADRVHLIGLTAVGRATIDALDMNRLRVVAIRQEDVLVGRHPPAGDPVQDGQINAL